MKKNNKILCISLIVLSAIACKKNDAGYTNDISQFDVMPRTLTVSVNDSVRFDMAGNPDNISFFSGETGSVYEYRNRTVLTGGKLKLKFQTRVINKPADTLDVLLSNDFTGIYDSANVAKAKWKSLTNKLLFPTALTPLSTFIPSGVDPSVYLDLTDSVVAGQPFYLAYKYTITKVSNIEWSVGQLAMYNFFSNGIANAAVIDSANNTNGGFVPVTMNEPVSKWSKTSTLYKCTSTTTAVIGAQHYYISRPLNPNAVKPDVPSVIKNISQSPLGYFSYKYTVPGTYKIAFVAANSRVNVEELSVKEFTIIVQ